MDYPSMRSSDHSRNKNRGVHHTSNPVFFDYTNSLSLYSRSEPKEKESDEEGWKQFSALCFGLVVLPSLVFS
jgi:hypothetical protein